MYYVSKPCGLANEVCTFFSSRRRHQRWSGVSWAPRLLLETGQCPIRSQTHESLCPCSKNLSLRALHNYRITVCIWLVSRINLYLFGELLIKLLLLIFAFRSLTNLGTVFLLEVLFFILIRKQIARKDRIYTSNSICI